MEAEIVQLKKSIALLQDEKLRLKTSHVRMELEMAKAMQAAGDFHPASSSGGGKGANMVLALRKKLIQTERALADKVQEVDALKQDARVAKTSELEREKSVLLSEVKRLMQAASTMARSVADANTSLASLPDQAATSSQNKSLLQECSQLKKHLQEVIAERDKAVADNTRIVSDSRSMMASAVEKALTAREKLITGDGIQARSAAQIKIDDLEKTNRKLQADFEQAKGDCKRSTGEIQRLKIRIQHLESLIGSGGGVQAAAVSFPPTSDKASSQVAAPATKPLASPSTLQELSFNCKHYTKSFLRTVVKVPFAISWPEFLKRLRDEFPGVCGCTYAHNEGVAVISNFRQFEQACERVEDAFIAGSSDGSLDILVMDFKYRNEVCAVQISSYLEQVIDDAAALANVSGTISKQPPATADSAPSSHRPQSGKFSRFQQLVKAEIELVNAQRVLDRDQLQAVRNRPHLEGQMSLRDPNL
jgi:hypothetical protein